jgi:regulator of sigma E protease
MTTIISTIFVLGVLIFIHELGHFFVAKRVGIKVEKFSLGFPPFIFKKLYGETEYCIGAVPLGGFVKMAGENPAEESTGAPYEFMSKPIWARSLVIVAGPLMNFLLAWGIMWGLFFFQGDIAYDTEKVVVGEVAEGAPAAEAGLQEGDIIKSINGQPVTSFVGMAELIKVEVEKPVQVVWERDGKTMSAAITTRAETAYTESGEKVDVGKIGVGQKVWYERVGFFPAIYRGLESSVYYVNLVGKFLTDLVSAKVSPKMIGGPVLIAQMAGETAQRGLSSLLTFMALLSVNLAVLNILPIPILDGGHLVFLGIEKLKGSPLSLRQRAHIQQIGLAFLVLLIVFVTYNDIVRFLTD